MKYLSKELTDKLPSNLKERRNLQLSKVQETEKELSDKYKTTVTSYTFTDAEGNVGAVYFRKPHRMVRPDIVTFLSKGDVGNAGALIYKHCILTAESDEKIMDDDDCYDGIIIRLGMDYNFEVADKKK